MAVSDRNAALRDIMLDLHSERGRVQERRERVKAALSLVEQGTVAWNAAALEDRALFREDELLERLIRRYSGWLQ
jgi:hypothetical protein